MEHADVVVHRDQLTGLLSHCVTMLLIESG